MVTVFFLVEGQTEEEFVKEVLNEDFLLKLGAHGRATLLGKKGGLPRFDRFESDLQKLIRSQRGRDGVVFTMMLDLYGLWGGWPGAESAKAEKDVYARVAIREKALQEKFDVRNFVPYLQLHEFEALLLAEPKKLLDSFPGAGEGVEQLELVVQTIGNCELINDTPEGAPSKRIQALIPKYDKVVGGNSTALNIGLQTLRERCRHFREWLEKLEAAIRAEHERLSP